MLVRGANTRISLSSQVLRTGSLYLKWKYFLEVALVFGFPFVLLGLKFCRLLLFRKVLLLESNFSHHGFLLAFNSSFHDFLFLVARHP